MRGINLASGDVVISMAILHHIEADSAERALYLKQSRLMRGEVDGADAAVDAGEDEAPNGSGELSPERYAAMGAAEQFVLTVSENGYGKRTSSFEIPDYRAWRQRHRCHGGQ